MCGFANAQGGTIYIGKNDGGKIQHISNTDKLLEDIPNQSRDLLGLMIDINLQTENNIDY
ncbi:AlbA family DNA-binding domain-containing protein [Sphingobacterium bovistauri]|uniref:AlbA family DNA-binding domain-containing protein n=1 Tax=Sphingobacterium bovistauri TaxID=2781959 RepID=UPI001CE218F4